MRSWRTWTILLVMLFIAFNIYYWKAYVCSDSKFCNIEDVGFIKGVKEKVENARSHNTTSATSISISSSAKPTATPIPEAHLENFKGSNLQPLLDPETHYPSSREKSSKDLDTIAPTSNKATYLLSKNGLKYANSGDLWQLGIINTRPDVFLVSNNHYKDINSHFLREYRIYTLMKWILRVHRRDSNRSTPLLMVDAGSNHGLFSLVAGASGAHAVAFEPQTHLRSVINMASRLNQLTKRLRVLPFAVLDQFKELAMEKVEINDGGIGGLSYNNPKALITTKTIRLDSMPAFKRLFAQAGELDASPATHSLIKEDKCIAELEELGADYAQAINSSLDVNDAVISDTLVLRQPIHFLKIDVEGFEIHALQSAAKLFENGLVENTVLEFGPPSRWDVTVPDASKMKLNDVRAKTLKEAKSVLHRAVEEWNLEIRLLPAKGWDKTIRFLLDHGVDESREFSSRNKVVRTLNAWKFDDLPLDNDEFEKEMEQNKDRVTEFAHLPPHLIDAYLDDSQNIGEMYLWFTKKDSKSAVLHNVI